MCPIFVDFVDNFDNDLMADIVKLCLFLIDTYVILCPAGTVTITYVGSSIPVFFSPERQYQCKLQAPKQSKIMYCKK